MRALPFATRVYVAAVIVAGGLLAATSLTRITWDQPVLFGVLLVLSSLASAFNISLPLARGLSTMSVSYAVDFASLLLLGPHATVLVAMTSAWSQCTWWTRARNPLYRTLFSMACLAITVRAAGAVYRGLGGIEVDLTIAEVAAPLVGAVTTYFLCNTALVAAAIALSTKQSVLRVWNENFLWSAPSYFVGAGAATLGAAAYEHAGYWLAVLTAAPIYLTYRSYRVYLGRIEEEQRHVREVSDLHLATIEALALAIDAKDKTAQTHIRRVQRHAERLARAAGMTDREINGVRTAALLHDIGKLAVPEHILSKPGPLTEEEFQKVRVHPKVGAEIIAAVPFPYPVAPLVLAHHERWDGCGYPNGLRGDEIPLGARVLTIVDYFDALVSDRPYHKAMAWEIAIDIVRQEAGRALDPRLVEIFLELLPDLRLAAEMDDPAMAGGQRSGQQPSEPGTKGEEGRKSVFEDIALAHREIYGLYEIAQAMGTSLGIEDTMALVSSKLSSLVPFSCCALFLHEKETDVLRCRFSAGTDSEVIRSIVLPGGAGLAGWAARTRRPVLNGRPQVDLQAAGMSATATRLASALVCPLVFNGRLIGTLSLYHLEPDCYSDDHQRLLDRVCEQAAAVIHNSIVFERTQEDSLTDPLTGLPNTRYLVTHFSRELSRAERLGSELTLLVMDVDDFKAINDQYGHQAGDRALRAIADRLLSLMRPYDVCVRYAGDEFIAVFSGCPAQEAERRRLELQMAIDRTPFDLRPGQPLPISISIGAAVFPRDGSSYEQLLASADSRMYRDKSRRKRLLPDSPWADPTDAVAAAASGIAPPPMLQ
jgi:diguanylate cyclase (GGDEF)-like protein/putative nucleotidyltransferase with HDIG domain